MFLDEIGNKMIQK